MKKIIISSLFLLSAIFLAGCTQQTAHTQQPTYTAPTTQEQSETTQPNSQSFIEVEELGFKIPVDSSMANELSYKMLNDAAIFSSKSLNAIDQACETSGAAISKIPGTPAAPTNGMDPQFYLAHIADTKQFDGFFLFLQGPQSSCTLGKNVELEKKAYQAVADAFKGAVLIGQ